MMIAGLILLCEISFWIFVLAGLYFRYILRLKRLGALLAYLHAAHRSAVGYSDRDRFTKRCNSQFYARPCRRIHRYFHSFWTSYD